MVKITFPDGSVREYEQGVTGFKSPRAFRRLSPVTLYLAE